MARVHKNTDSVISNENEILVYFSDQHDNLALAPFLDMFNHSGHVQVHVENTDHFYNLKSRYFKISSLRFNFV